MEADGATARLFNDVLRAISLSLDLREGRRQHHGWRVAELGYRIAGVLDLDDREAVFQAGLLHDLGCDGHHRGVNEAEDVSLAARGALEASLRTIAGVSSLRRLAPLVAQHHERFDGRGCPGDLAGDAILPGAAALRLADLLEINLRIVGPQQRLDEAVRFIRLTRRRAVSPRVADATADLLHSDRELLALLFDEQALNAAVRARNFLHPEVAALGSIELLGELLWLFASIIDAKHPFMRGHSARVAAYASAIAEAVGGDALNRWDVLWAGLLHDVGEMAVPRELFEKTAPLAPAERRTLARHPRDSHEIIASIHDLAHLALPTASHHERYDGNGYPNGLKGEGIPLLGRVLAFADTYDAITSWRSYREPLPHAEAIARIRQLLGTQLDPHLAEIALPALERLHATGAGVHAARSFSDLVGGTATDVRQLLRPQARDRQLVRNSGTGVLLLELEPWRRLLLTEALQIIEGGAELATLVSGVDGDDFRLWLDPASAGDLRRLLDELPTNGVATRYLFACTGKPLESVLLRRPGGYELLYRTAENRIQSMSRMALFYRNFMSSSEAVCFTDATGTILDVNRTFLDVFEYQLKDVIGQKPWFLKSNRHPIDSDAIWDSLRDPRIGSWSGELVTRTRTGGELPVSVVVTSVRDPNGAFIGFVGRAVDITARHRAEERMAAINQCLLRLGQNAADDVALVTEVVGQTLGAACVCLDRVEGDTLMLEGGWNLPLGFTDEYPREGSVAAEALGEPTQCVTLYDLLRSRWYRTDARLAAHGFATWIGRRVHAGGKRAAVLSVFFHGARTLGPEDTDFCSILAGALASARERHTALEALRTSEERYRVIAEGASDVIWTMSLDGRILYRSPSAAALYGISPKEVEEASLFVRVDIGSLVVGVVQALGLPSPEENLGLQGPEQAARLLRDRATRNALAMAIGVVPSELEAAFADMWSGRRPHLFARLLTRIDELHNGRPFLLEFTISHPSGRSIPVETKISLPRGPDGHPLHVEGITRDISPRKQMELELRAKNEELDRLNTLKTDLIAITSHDLRSPLNAILSYARLMHEEADSLTSESARHYLERILSSGDRLIHFINNVLDLEKIRAGTYELSPTRSSLESILRTSVEINAGGAQARRVQVALEVPPDLPPVFADVVRLEQVFNNLLSNAIKFSPEGGRVELVATRRGNTLRTEVLDQGPGVPESERDRIFDRYYQVQSSAQSPRAFGTGLGLSIVKNVVELHGGRVWVENRPGGGCRFVVELRAEVPAAEPRSVLILDPQGRIAGSLAPVLTQRGLRYEVASDTINADAAATRLRPSLVFAHASALTDEWRAFSTRLEEKAPGVVRIAVGEEGTPTPQGFDRELTLPLLDVEVHELLRQTATAGSRGGGAR